MKKVLIIGEKFSTNLGDGIICEVVEHIFNKDFIVHTLDLSGRENYQIERRNIKFNIYNEKKVQIKNFIRKILKVIGINFYREKSQIIFKKYEKKLNETLNNFRPDTIVFAGGQMFMDCFLNQIEFTINVAQKKNINVFFNACGIGKIVGIRNKRKLASLLSKNNVNYISVRDNYKYIEKLTKVSDIIETYDTAILCCNIYKKEKTTSKVGIGIMLSHSTNIIKQINFWTAILQQFKKSNFEWEIFCNGSDADYAFIKYLLKQINLDEKKIAMQPVTPNDLVAIITKYNKIISMRLHSLIIAYSYDIPAIAISWDKKVNDFYKKINKESYCFNFEKDTSEIFATFYGLDSTFINNKTKKKITNDIYSNIDNIKKIINQRSEKK